MSNLFDGLYLYEIILMILGSILFLMVIFLIYRNKKLDKNYLAGLALAIVMIAFPSIKSFSISDGIIKIEKDLEKLKVEPETPETEKEIEAQLSDLGNRPISDPERLTTLSEANLEIGKKQQAETLAKKALKKSPENMVAKEVVNVLEVDKDIESVMANPNDENAKKNLTKHIENLRKIPTPSGRRTSKIAKGYEVLGHRDMAKAYVDSTKIYQPKHPYIQKYERIKPLIPIDTTRAGSKINN